MKRKFTAIMLAVVMIASVFSFGTLTVSAEETAHVAITKITVEALTDVITIGGTETFTPINLTDNAKIEPEGTGKSVGDIVWTITKKGSASETSLIFDPTKSDYGYGTYTIEAMVLGGGKDESTPYTQKWTVAVTELIAAADVSYLASPIATETSIPYYIDLINEKLGGTAFEGTNKFTIQSYSIDGGTKWKKFGAKDDFLKNGGITKLLNKAMTLQISNQPINKKTKKPEAGAAIVTFTAIAARPKVTKSVVNYLVEGKALNEWTLTAKGGTTVVENIGNIEISGIAGKVDTDSIFEKLADKKARNWKTFEEFADAGLTLVKTFKEKPFKTPYAVRIGSNKTDDGSYVPATKEFKINVSSEIKAPKAPKCKPAATEGQYTVTFKAGTITNGTSAIVGGNWEPATSGDFAKGTKMSLRTAPTVKKPISAAVELTVQD